ncbi:MAG: hypothetical protein QOF62_2593 [Pyrinomonadaceae bacterium]|jgi:hypothetical protein|nr:hypothetical protein [Pyrinomonadaceae bacterium]
MALTRYEASLLAPVADYFHRRSFHWQQNEMPFYDHRIDLYAFSTAKDVTVAVELKLTDWRKAFKQALIYSLCSDWVYIAAPVKTCDRVDQDLLIDSGIGLLAVYDTGRCRRVISPSSSLETRPHYRTAHIDLLRDAKHVKG